MRMTVSSKGEVVLPAELRKLDRIRPGQQFSIERIEAGAYLLKKMPSVSGPGLVDWLLACPEKGWYAAVEPESADTD